MFNKKIIRIFAKIFQNIYFMGNMFIEAANFQPTTMTENGAKAYYTTGSKVVDQFGLAGNYRNRSYDEVYEDQAALWEEDKDAAIRLPFYLRLITRSTRIGEGDKKTEKVQNGQGQRDEFYKRLLWFAEFQPDVLYKNLWLVPVIGSWKDLWMLLYYDRMKDRTLDVTKVFDVFKAGLESETHRDLVKKFMPRIKSSSKKKTDWARITGLYAKQLAKYLGLSYEKYTKLKASGCAHDFQKLICAREYDKINWNLIPGRALLALTSGEFLENHKLVENYIKWLDTKPCAKFTGYPYELIAKYRQSKRTIQVKHTIDKQFNQLVQVARENGRINENVLVCLDTSGSMCSLVDGLSGISCSDIANSLALFFAELNEGYFHNKVMMFDNTSYAHDLGDRTFTNKLDTLPRVPCGGTNFQSVANELVKIRTEHPEIPLSDYCTTLLVVSDMQFNETNFWNRNRGEATNFEATVAKLKEAFPSEFVDSMKFIWWNCASRRETFEGDAFTSGCTFLSGFDGSIISILLGENDAEEKVVVDEKTGEEVKVKVTSLTAEELAYKALNQEILNYLTT